MNTFYTLFYMRKNRMDNEGKGAFCLSKSLRSVTTTTLGFVISLSKASDLASITIVNDLPLPCVCHTTPPLRFPSLSKSFTRFMAAFTVKYCW